MTKKGNILSKDEQDVKAGADAVIVGVAFAVLLYFLNTFGII